jgi:hypothetical protein
VEDVRKLLAKIVCATMLTNEEVTFQPQEEEDKDLVHLGICQLVKVKGDYRWKLSEPLAIRVAHEVLNAVTDMDGPKTVLHFARNNLYDILFKLGIKASAKG